MRVYNNAKSYTAELDEFPRAFQLQKAKEKRRKKGVFILVAVVYLLIALALLIRFYMDTFKDGFYVAGKAATEEDMTVPESQVIAEPEEVQETIVAEEPPVKDLKLSDANIVASQSVNTGEEKDRRGNKYRDAIASDTDEAYIVFNPEYKYKYLRGTIASGLGKFPAEFSIYGDDILLYSSGQFDVYSAPQDFECNIEGVDLLRIEFSVDGNSLSYNPLIIADAVFTNND